MITKTQLQRGNRWLLLLLLMAGSMAGYAQSECFTYEEGSNGTVITGLTGYGTGATSLTIPAAVTAVRSGAFASASPSLEALIVEGGNPAFESGLFGEITNTLTSIDMGDGMTVTNMIALLQSVGSFKEGTTIVADGFSGDSDASDDTWNAVTWTGVTSVTLPAELVAPTSYGSATVYGRFSISKEIISFCGSATFLDDGNSNMLFYVADKIADGRLHIQRVWYVAAGEGVLIHRSGSISGYADLKRDGDINDNTDRAKADKALYESNMLKGVTTATIIAATDGTHTNYVLKNGAFHPTSGGTIKANRAYLQLPSSARAETLAIEFPDEETEIKSLTPAPSPMEEGSGYYDLQGRKLDTKPTTKGIYINNGKKYIIR